MRRHTEEVRQFTHLHANRLTGIAPTTGYGMTSRPESRNVASTRPRAETFLQHFCNRWYHPARLFHRSQNHQTSECRMYHRAMLPMMLFSSPMENPYQVTSSNFLKTTQTWTSTMPSVSSRKSKKPSRKFDKARSCTELSNLKLSRQFRMLRPWLSAYLIQNAISVYSVNLPLQQIKEANSVCAIQLINSLQIMTNDPYVHYEQPMLIYVILLRRVGTLGRIYCNRCRRRHFWFWYDGVRGNQSCRTHAWGKCWSSPSRLHSCVNW